MSTNIKSPLFILGAAPSSKVEILNFFLEDSHFFKLLKDPPHMRYMGWNLLTLDYPKIIDGQSWEVRNGDRKTIRLYRDGSFVAVTYADNTFLGWGQKDEDFANNPQLNTLALIEYIYEFVELYRNFLTHFPKIKEVRFDIGIKNYMVGQKPLSLVPSKINDPFYLHKHDARTLSNDFTETLVIPIPEEKYDSKYIAFKLLSKVFIRFGHPEDKIPYTATDSDGNRFIDPTQFPAN